MLTPQEVSQHAFAKASFGGYNMGMVDEFLDAITEDYTVLYKENAVLKSKMKILVDKVEEYRSTDESMRKAFLVAQKSAEDIVARAEADREEMMKTAEAEARAKISGLRQELEDEKLRLTSAQAATAAYLAKAQTLLRQQLEYLAALPELTTPPPTREEKAACEIESSMQKIVEEETPVSPGAGDEAPEPDVDLEEEHSPVADGSLYAELLELNITHKAKPDGGDDTAPTRSIDFDNLQFGKDYEIK